MCAGVSRFHYWYHQQIKARRHPVRGRRASGGGLVLVLVRARGRRGGGATAPVGRARLHRQDTSKGKRECKRRENIFPWVSHVNKENHFIIIMADAAVGTTTQIICGDIGGTNARLELWAAVGQAASGLPVAAFELQLRRRRLQRRHDFIRGPAQPQYVGRPPTLTGQFCSRRCNSHRCDETVSPVPRRYLPERRSGPVPHRPFYAGMADQGRP